MGGVNITVSLEHPGGNLIAQVSEISAPSDGSFVFGLVVPPLEDGTYVLRATPSDDSIEGGSVSVRIETPVSWWGSPLFGVPAYLWIIMMFSGLAIGLGGWLALHRVSATRTSQCGKCGTTMPRDVQRCPSCGADVPPPDPGAF